MDNLKNKQNGTTKQIFTQSLVGINTAHFDAVKCKCFIYHGKREKVIYGKSWIFKRLKYQYSCSFIRHNTLMPHFRT